MPVDHRYAASWEERIGVRESFVPDRDDDVASLPGGAAYGPMVDALRGFLDTLAAAAPDERTSTELAADLRRWGDRLAALEVVERERPFGRRVELDGRGQVMAPAFVLEHRGPDSVEGHVTFGDYFLGGHGAVHGGAITLLMDEVLGRLSDTDGRPSARTASLRTDFRAVTPVGVRLQMRAWIEREEGRKRFVRGELTHGGRVCAEAEGLFLALLEGQA